VFCIEQHKSDGAEVEAKGRSGVERKVCLPCRVQTTRLRKNAD
jgi:hypothetical protein